MNGAGETGNLDEVVPILLRSRDCLKRWAARYAESDHAKKHVAETRALMADIEEWTHGGATPDCDLPTAISHSISDLPSPISHR
jgi:hypothetical protein